MDRNELLSEIVASAEQEVMGLDKTASYTENPEAVKKIPVDKPTSVISKLKERSFHNQATYTEDLHEINNVGGGPNTSPEMVYPKLSTDKETNITKLAHSSDEIVSLIREAEQELNKKASVDETNISYFLEKTAAETIAEINDLEKTAEEFGTMVARAFLSEIGRY